MSNRPASPYRKTLYMFTDENGQGLVEYALIILLVAIVVIVAIQALGSTVGSAFSTVNMGIH